VSYIANKILEKDDIEMSYKSFQLAVAYVAKTNEPTFKNAMTGPNRESFIEAIKREYKSLKEHKVFSKPCDLPDGKTALDTKMVLKIKETPDEDPLISTKTRN
jgi:hypothetical protein